MQMEKVFNLLVTKRHKVSSLKKFMVFVRVSFDTSLNNPCSSLLKSTDFNFRHLLIYCVWHMKRKYRARREVGNKVYGYEFIGWLLVILISV